MVGDNNLPCVDRREEPRECAAKKRRLRREPSWLGAVDVSGIVGCGESVEIGRLGNSRQFPASIFEFCP